MTTHAPTAELDARFSNAEAAPPPWSQVEDILKEAEIFWLSTVRHDGRPHVTPLPAVYLDQRLHFCTGAGEQKTINLESNPACILTTGHNALRSGMDVVVEGSAVRVTDDATLRRLADLWRSTLDWPFEVQDGGFRDGDGRVGLVFGVAPAKVLAFGKGEPFSQTRYRF